MSAHNREDAGPILTALYSRNILPKDDVGGTMFIVTEEFAKMRAENDALKARTVHLEHAACVLLGRLERRSNTLRTIQKTLWKDISQHIVDDHMKNQMHRAYVSVLDDHKVFLEYSDDDIALPLLSKMSHRLRTPAEEAAEIVTVAQQKLKDEYRARDAAYREEVHELHNRIADMQVALDDTQIALERTRADAHAHTRRADESTMRLTARLKAREEELNAMRSQLQSGAEGSESGGVMSRTISDATLGCHTEEAAELRRQLDELQLQYDFDKMELQAAAAEAQQKVAQLTAKMEAAEKFAQRTSEEAAHELEERATSEAEATAVLHRRLSEANAELGEYNRIHGVVAQTVVGIARSHHDVRGCADRLDITDDAEQIDAVSKKADGFYRDQMRHARFLSDALGDDAPPLKRLVEVFMDAVSMSEEYFGKYAYTRRYQAPTTVVTTPDGERQVQLVSQSIQAHPKTADMCVQYQPPPEDASTVSDGGSSPRTSTAAGSPRSRRTSADHSVTHSPRRTSLTVRGAVPKLSDKRRSVIVKDPQPEETVGGGPKKSQSSVGKLRKVVSKVGTAKTATTSMKGAEEDEGEVLKRVAAHLERKNVALQDNLDDAQKEAKILRAALKNKEEQCELAEEVAQNRSLEIDRLYGQLMTLQAEVDMRMQSNSQTHASAVEESGSELRDDSTLAADGEEGEDEDGAALPKFGSMLKGAFDDGMSATDIMSTASPSVMHSQPSREPSSLRAAFKPRISIVSIDAETVQSKESTPRFAPQRAQSVIVQTSPRPWGESSMFTLHSTTIDSLEPRSRRVSTAPVLQPPSGTAEEVQTFIDVVDIAVGTDPVRFLDTSPRSPAMSTPTDEAPKPFGSEDLETQSEGSPSFVAGPSVVVNRRRSLQTTTANHMVSLPPRHASLTRPASGDMFVEGVNVAVAAARSRSGSRASSPDQQHSHHHDDIWIIERNARGSTRPQSPLRTHEVTLDVPLPEPRTGRELLGREDWVHALQQQELDAAQHTIQSWQQRYSTTQATVHSLEEKNRALVSLMKENSTKASDVVTSSALALQTKEKLLRSKERELAERDEAIAQLRHELEQSRAMAAADGSGSAAQLSQQQPYLSRPRSGTPQRPPTRATAVSDGWNDPTLGLAVEATKLDPKTRANGATPQPQVSLPEPTRTVYTGLMQRMPEDIEAPIAKIMSASPELKGPSVGNVQFTQFELPLPQPREASGDHTPQTHPTSVLQKDTTALYMKASRQRRDQMKAVHGYLQEIGAISSLDDRASMPRRKTATKTPTPTVRRPQTGSSVRPSVAQLTEASFGRKAVWELRGSPAKSGGRTDVDSKIRSRLERLRAMDRELGMDGDDDGGLTKAELQEYGVVHVPKK